MPAVGRLASGTRFGQRLFLDKRLAALVAGKYQSRQQRIPRKT